MQIRVIESESWNWYRVGEIFTVRDAHKYGDIGVQVHKNSKGVSPDVVQHGHYEFV
ncbi:hypothetical protein [Brevibacillus centrosporus]|uniref:hypothetical protein n=1 Tax=Brevibacillus centrosporus TaxID=54910 RepID=UPI003B027A36